MKAILVLFLFSAIPAFAVEPADYSSLCNLNQTTVSRAATQARTDFTDKNIRSSIASNISNATSTPNVQITLFDMNSRTFQVNANGKLINLGFDVIYPDDQQSKEAQQATETATEPKDVKDASAAEQKIVVDKDQGPDLIDKAKELFATSPKIDVVTSSSLAKDKSFDKFGNFISPNQISCDVSVYLQKTTILHIYNYETRIPVVDVKFDNKDPHNKVTIPVVIPLKEEAK